MKAIILSAGMGTRLKLDKPKSLTEIYGGKCILDFQINALKKYIKEENIYLVVGHKKEEIIEKFPKLKYIVNNNYKETNTSKSLLKGLKNIEPSTVIWMNGDVFFEDNLLKKIVTNSKSCIAVNKMKVGEEEVKYNLRKNGSIYELSKNIKDGLGEAVGINKVNKEEIGLLIKELEECNNQDYFEKGVEKTIDRIFWSPVDISDYVCIEIDFKEDLEQARSLANILYRGK